MPSILFYAYSSFLIFFKDYIMSTMKKQVHIQNCALKKQKEKPTF